MTERRGGFRAQQRLRAGGMAALALIAPRWRAPVWFDADWYLRSNPDVANLGTDALWHYLRHGRAEGRMPRALAASELELLLWQGDTEAEAALAHLAAGQDRPERIWARLALARLRAAQEDWPAVRQMLDEIDAQRDLVKGFGLPDPVLFLAETQFRCGDPAAAGAVLRLARQGFGDLPDLRLVEAALAVDGRGWQERIAPIFAAHGLAAPGSIGGASGLDGLQAESRPVTGGPLVSVVLPVRDGAATIDTALRGLVAQSWRNLEILVVDNGSRDGTAARVAGWSARDRRIRLIDGGGALGAYGARNLGVVQAQGEYLTFHDADDWSHPDRIARQMQALAVQPEHPASLSFWARMTADLRVTTWRADVRVIHPNLTSLLLRRAVLDRIGYWDIVQAGADSEYLARLRHVFGRSAVVMVLPGVPIAFGRQVAGSLSRSGTTGLSGPGRAARHAYLAAAAAWHAATPTPWLPAEPGPRAFAVPDLLRPEGAG